MEDVVTVPGYLSTSNRHPVSLGLAVALTGAGLTALLLVKPMVQHIMPAPKLTAEEIAIDVPPPPLPLKQVKLLETRPVNTSGPVIDSSHPTPADNRDIVFDSPSFPGPDFGMGSTIKVDPVVPDPILTEAMPDPRFSSGLQPPYPASLQRLEIEGTATVRVQIDVDGHVLRVESVRADNDGFLTATRVWALRHWRFKPAMRDGVAVMSWKTMTVRFQMNR
jgi:protein TonB